MHSFFSYRWASGLMLIGVIVAMTALQPAPARADVQEEITRRNQLIEQLQQQIEVYQQEIDSNRAKAGTLQTEINRLNAQVNQVTLEIRSLSYSIDQTNLQIGDHETRIKQAEDHIARNQQALGQYIRLAYQNDQRNLTEVLLKHDTLSDFFGEVNDIQTTQNQLQIAVDDIRRLRDELAERKADLEGDRQELEKLKTLQEIEKRGLDGTKSQKNKLLKDTRGEESRYQTLVKKTQTDIEGIRAQITFLQQNGISAEDAIKYGQLAAIQAGIRPEFLLAELEQESALGINVGKCYITDATSGATRHVSNGKVYAKGIHPTRDLPLFLTITAELNRDPFQTPVSCGSGWGGAMGPAQFIPSTWIGYRAEITRLTGHALPDPWNIEDAFVAAATKLARDGANSKTTAGEIAASKRYYCGSATSKASGCINYANSVQRKATAIAASL